MAVKDDLEARQKRRPQAGNKAVVVDGSGARILLPLQQGKKMLLSEEEAKTKWCPMVRTHIAVNVDYYRIRTATGPAVNKGTNKALCIASDCMMWRWGDPGTEFKVDVPAYETKGDPIGHDAPVENRRGYCGLANLPIY